MNTQCKYSVHIQNVILLLASTASNRNNPPVQLDELLIAPIICKFVVDSLWPNVSVIAPLFYFQ